MKFQTGDLAEFMGITNMGVIYLEKRGIIHSTREGNGYRMFDAETVSDLALIRSYERMGFSLDNAILMSHQAAYDVLEQTTAKRHQLEQQLELIRYFESWVHTLKSSGHPLVLEDICIMNSPELYYCPLWEETPEFLTASKESKKQMRDIDVSWISAMPYMHFCDKITLQQGSWSFMKGNCIIKQYAQSEHVLLNELTEYISSKRSLHFCCEVEKTTDVLPELQQYANAHQLTLDFPAFAIILNRDVDGGKKIAEFYIPVKKYSVKK